MPWLQIQFSSNAADAERFADALQQHGALSVTFVDAADQPVYEPGVNQTPLWQATEIIALFDWKTDLEQLRSYLEHAGQLNWPAWTVTTLPDQEWSRAWMSHYQPMQFGERLWICPSHCALPDPTAVNILLDPGLAFGTGTHPTTAMCLRWLAAHPPTDQVVIDYGCGSGILALAAAKLGAHAVYAIDNDPQALLATQENARLNDVVNRVFAFTPDNTAVPAAGTLLANILAEPLLELAGRFTTLLQPGGNIVLSGILLSQAARICNAYSATFDLQIDQTQEDWVCLTGRRRPTRNDIEATQRS